LAAIIAFGGCLWGSFHFDDYSLFSGSLWRPFDIRPLTYLTFWLDNKLGGRAPAGYHAVNLLLHCLAVLLLWLALRRVVPARAAWIAAAIFAVHPVEAEAVNYVFARSTLLATVLCLAALACWTGRRYWWAVPWFAAALLAKEECVAFPVFLLLFQLATSRELKWKPLAVMFGLSAAAGVRVLLATAEISGSAAGLHSEVAWQSYALAQGGVILRYLRMLVLPWGFTADPAISVPPLWLGALAWMAVLALTALALPQFRAARAGLWFVGGLVLLLPSSSILPATDLAADRRMYLPMIGFAACAGLLLERTRPVFVGAALVLLTGLSIERTLIWRTEQSLWSDAADKAPDKIRPKIQLARAVDPERALAILEDAQRIAPNDPKIPAEEGRILLGQGKTTKALVEFGRSLALDPRGAEAFNNRGAALLALDQKQAARADFERALAIDPCEWSARVNLRRLGVVEAPPRRCNFSTEERAALGSN
jgi:tetratricopeptide (TPR) repeat protein